MGDFAKEIQSKFPNERIKAMLNIKYTSSKLDHLGEQLLRPFNISEQQYNVLRILKGANKPVRVNDVKDRMIQKSPNTTRLMDKLFDKKLIDRSRCESDRRVVFIEITTKGRELLEKINVEELEKRMETLTIDEAKELNRLLDKIKKT